MTAEELTQQDELEAFAVAEEQAEIQAEQEIETPVEKGTINPEIIGDIDTGEMLCSLLTVGFGLVAARKGEHWNLSEAEAKQTGAAVGAVLDKYFPDLTQHGPEITAVMACSMVFVPRIMADKQIEKQIQDVEKKNAQRDFDLSQDSGDMNNGD